MNIREGASYLKYHTWFYNEGSMPHRHFVCNLNKVHMKILMQFRLSCSCLAINNHSIPRSARCCPFCANAIEDEKHFIFACQGYNSIRTHQDFAVLWATSERHDMKQFFNQVDQALIAKAILSMYKLRSTKLQSQT